MDPVDAQSAISPVEPPNGRYQGKLDENGRLKLPVPFQTYIGSLPEKGLFVTSIDRTTVQIYPSAVWRLNKKLFSEQKERKEEAETILFNAQDYGADTEMDKSGRITFNGDLRKELDLDGQPLHFFVNDGHILLFTEAIYQMKRAASIAATKQALKSMKEAGLQ